MRHTVIAIAAHIGIGGVGGVERAVGEAIVRCPDIECIGRPETVGVQVLVCDFCGECFVVSGDEVLVRVSWLALLRLQDALSSIIYVIISKGFLRAN